MTRCLLCAILTMMLALQAIVLAQAAMAACGDSQAVAASSDCPGHSAAPDRACPCEGVSPVGCASAGCASACMTMAVPIASSTPAAASLGRSALVPFVSGVIFSQTYAPPNPPPIR